MKLNIAKSFKLALVITLVVALLSVVLNLLNLGVTIQPLFSIGPIPIDPYTPFTGSVSDKVISFMSGLLPFELDIAAWTTVFISAFAIVFIGMLIKGILPMNLPKIVKGGDIFWTIFLGTLVFWVILAGMKFAPWGSIAGFALYGVVVSYLTAVIAPKIGVNVN